MIHFFNYFYENYLNVQKAIAKKGLGIKWVETNH